MENSEEQKFELPNSPIIAGSGVYGVQTLLDKLFGRGVELGRIHDEIYDGLLPGQKSVMPEHLKYKEPKYTVEDYQKLKPGDIYKPPAEAKVKGLWQLEHYDASLPEAERIRSKPVPYNTPDPNLAFGQASEIARSKGLTGLIADDIFGADPSGKMAAAKKFGTKWGMRLGPATLTTMLSYYGNQEAKAEHEKKVAAESPTTLSPEAQDKKLRAVRALMFGGQESGYAAPTRAITRSQRTAFMRDKAGSNMMRMYDALESGAVPLDENTGKEVQLESGISTDRDPDIRQATYDNAIQNVLKGTKDPAALWNDAMMLLRASNEEYELKESELVNPKDKDAIKAHKDKIKKNTGVPEFIWLPGYQENWSENPKYKDTAAIFGLYKPKDGPVELVTQYFDKEGQTGGTLFGPVNKPKTASTSR